MTTLLIILSDSCALCSTVKPHIQQIEEVCSNSNVKLVVIGLKDNSERGGPVNVHNSDIDAYNRYSYMFNPHGWVIDGYPYIIMLTEEADREAAQAHENRTALRSILDKPRTKMIYGCTVDTFEYNKVEKITLSASNICTWIKASSLYLQGGSHSKAYSQSPMTVGTYNNITSCPVNLMNIRGRRR